MSAGLTLLPDLGAPWLLVQWRDNVTVEGNKVRPVDLDAAAALVETANEQATIHTREVVGA